MIRPLHLGISVPDMDASVEWYREMLGFNKISDEFVEFLNARTVFMQLGDFQIELFQYMGEDKKPLPPERLDPNEDRGTKHLAYCVEDLKSLMEELAAKNVDVVKPIFNMNGDLVCFIRDNSGILIELIQRNGGK
jgi:methylmalonyl-CoA/ethylmalonyl-CoA epimerase